MKYKIPSLQMAVEYYICNILIKFILIFKGVPMLRLANNCIGRGPK